MTSSPLHPFRMPAIRRGRSAALRGAVSGLALAAGSLGFTAVATPASAQCVENPANVYVCSGALDTTQNLNGPTVTVLTNPGFTVDTTNNGGGLALTAWATGPVSYSDTNLSLLAGGGAAFQSDLGGLNIQSNGDIATTSTLYALTLQTLNAGAIEAFWTGHINNTVANGLIASGGGDIVLNVSSISALGNAALILQNGTGDTSLTATGAIFAEDGAGVSVMTGPASGGVSLNLQAVSGNSHGVLVDHAGTGGTAVWGAGPILSNGVGVQVYNGAGSGELYIDVADVGAADNAILAVNNGDSGTFVWTGDLLSFGTALSVDNGATAGDLTVITGNVNAQGAGLSIGNGGTGETGVTVTGSVQAALGDGVYVGTGPQAQNVVIDVRAVSAGDNGIVVSHSGTGAVDLAATGAVIGIGGDGVRVESGSQSTGVTLTTAAVSGALDGITVDNFGAGDVVITANDMVIGEQQHGIRVANDDPAGNLRIDARAVQGGQSGIFVTQEGTGLVEVNATGTVIGETGNGIRVTALDQSTGVIVNGASASGLMNGVEVGNFGGGDTLVALSGLAVGVEGNGVQVNAGTGAGNLLIDVAAAVGDDNGIAAINQGGGETSIIVRELAEGAWAGVSASSLFGGDIYIENQGVIRGDMAAATSRALRASTADAITVNNAGMLLGTAEFHGGGALMFNTGIWVSSGESLFDGADDWLVNAAGGQIFGAADDLAAETTTWAGLERFDSEATLSLIDSGAGDVLLTPAETTFQAGSILAVDFGGLASDVFRTAATLEIQAGSGLVLNQTGALTLHHRYVVAEGVQGLTGEFDFDDVFLSAFAGLRDGYTTTEAYVEFAQLRALAEAGLTPNQKAAAGGADSLPDGNAVKDALLLLPTDDIAREAFDQLSGEVHATARTATMEDSRLPRDTVLDRLADGAGSGALWARAFEGRSVSDGDFNAARAERDVRGVMVGVDRSLGGAALVGVSMGMLKSEIDIERRTSEAGVESVHGLVYGGVELGAWRVSGGLGYARTVTETRREIAFPGVAGAPTADYDGSVLQGFLDAGYRMPASGGWVEPFASLAAVRVQSDAFVEAGGPEALSGERINEDAVISTLGLRFETNPTGPFSLRGTAGWRRNWGDVDPVGRHAFDSGDTFEVLGAAQSENAAVARVEAQWRLAPRVGFGLAYDGVLGDDGADHAITGTFKVVF